LLLLIIPAIILGQHYRERGICSLEGERERGQYGPIKDCEAERMRTIEVADHLMDRHLEHLVKQFTRDLMWLDFILKNLKEEIKVTHEERKG